MDFVEIAGEYIDIKGRRGPFSITVPHHTTITDNILVSTKITFGDRVFPVVGKCVVSETCLVWSFGTDADSLDMAVMLRLRVGDMEKMTGSFATLDPVSCGMLEIDYVNIDPRCDCLDDLVHPHAPPIDVQETQKEPETQTECQGCLEDQPNQQAHMMPGGCLYFSD